MHPEVGAGEGDELAPELVQGRRDRPVRAHLRGGDDDAVQPVAGRAGAESLVGLADLGDHGGDGLRCCGHLHLAQQALDPGGLAGEGDAELLAHRGAPAVAADDVSCVQVGAVGQLCGHPVGVLAERDQLGSALDLRAELDGSLGQQAVRLGLGDAEDVGVRGVQVRGHGVVDAGEVAAERIRLAVGEEPAQEPALVHQLDAAHVQTEGPDVAGRFGFLVHHDHAGAVQPQLAGQHETRRTSTDHEDVDHELRSASMSSPLRIEDRPSMPISAARLRSCSTVQSS